MDLHTGDVDKAVTDSLKFDKFKGLVGPTPPDPSFLKDMKVIDPRLVLRYNPHQNLYMVWLHMGGEKLWGQPTHVIHDGHWGFRKPDQRDIELLRKANYLASKLNHHAKEEAAESQDEMANEKAKYAREIALQGASQALAKKYDLTREKISTRDDRNVYKPFSGGIHLVRGLADGGN